MVVAGIVLYLGPKLPPVEQILDIQLQTPLRIYSSDDKLIAEFGEKKRAPIAYDQIPVNFVHAILAAEDQHFFHHYGVDPKGLIRAAVELVSTGSIQSGGSTITMQVAKNYFLSSERTFLRKFNEILLALELERELSKEKILELYVNKIYLGHRAYGVQAAAQVYYGKPVQQLDLAQLATIAGLPKAPSAYNPVTNPARAMERRNWILSRMLDLGYINKTQYQAAIAEPNTAELHGIPIQVQAPYFAEMVRRDMVDRFGDRADEDGYTVYTSLKSVNQIAAKQAVQMGLIDYDKRHGYRGPEATLNGTPADSKDAWQQALLSYRTIGPLEPAVVMNVATDKADVLLKSGEIVAVPWSTMQWARPYISTTERGPAPKSPQDVVKPGQVIRIMREDNHWALAEVPQVQSAMVSLDPQNGGILALVGGFDYQSSKFNRVIQAGRQPGSNIKPFIYTAALEKGMTPATLINDAPIVMEDTSLESAWRPENSGGKFLGPIRMRQALYKSRNLASIRILRSIGVPYAIDFLKRFGFTPDELPNNLTLALGSASITPLQIATGYATFANGGYKVEPWYIQRIVDGDGKVVYEANPATVCDQDCQDKNAAAAKVAAETQPAPVQDLLAADNDTAPASPTADGPAPASAAPTPALPAPAADATPPHYAEQVLDPQANFLITSMMQDVIRRGTGVRARALNRPDIAGKTGTTNDQKDAWFSGFNHDVEATVWVGFDQPQTLGRHEFGGTAALPIWMDYMKAALKDNPVKSWKIPDGIVTVRIDPKTGKRATPEQSDGIFEYFRKANVPPFDNSSETAATHPGETEMPEQLF